MFSDDLKRGDEVIVKPDFHDSVHELPIGQVVDLQKDSVYREFDSIWVFILVYESHPRNVGRIYHVKPRNIIRKV